jgi:hypothetical protein
MVHFLEVWDNRTNLISRNPLHNIFTFFALAYILMMQGVPFFMNWSLPVAALCFAVGILLFIFSFVKVCLTATHIVAAKVRSVLFVMMHSQLLNKINQLTYSKPDFQRYSFTKNFPTAISTH